MAELLASLHSDPPRPIVPHPALQEPYAVLVTIRRLARQYLMDDRNWDEYYVGLVIALLGSLKYSELALTGVRLALVGASVICSLIGTPVSYLVAMPDIGRLAQLRQRKYIIRWILYGTLGSTLISVFGIVLYFLFFPYPSLFPLDTAIGLAAVVSAIWGAVLSVGLACGEFFQGWHKAVVRIIASTIAVALLLIIAVPVLNEARADFYAFLLVSILYTLVVGIGTSLGEQFWPRPTGLGYLISGCLGVLLVTSLLAEPFNALIDIGVVIGTGIANILRPTN